VQGARLLRTERCSAAVFPKARGPAGSIAGTEKRKEAAYELKEIEREASSSSG
jgi:hypothetical protein